MKPLLTIVILLLCAISNGQHAIRRLPKPTQEQIKNELVEKGQNYLENNFKKIGDKVIFDTYEACNGDCICSWEQQFGKGIKYKHDSCNENGFLVTITFQGYDTSEIIRLVDTLFKTKGNVWNKEKTKYEPKEDEPGCFYEIRQEKGVAILEYVCTC